MRQTIYISIALLFLSCSLTVAQEWSKEDSIWLKNVLEGKEELKINEATKKAIEEGRLIDPSRIIDMDKKTDLELNKESENPGRRDSVRMRVIDPYSMPPAVYALYILYMEKMDSAYRIQSLVITEDERKALEALTPYGASAIYLYPEGFAPGFGGNVDFNHALSMLFSAQYRRKVYNRTHATAYKSYYDSGFASPIRITERERKQLNNAINSYKPSINTMPGQRRGGIDN